MAFVLDASVALCWVLPGQSTTASIAILNRAKDEEVIVPPLWHIEVANHLGLKLRNGVLDQALLAKALEILGDVDVTTAVSTWRSPAALVAAMGRYKLTAYDAEYLELAIRKGLPLATFDKELLAAAPQACVALVA